MQSSSSGSDNRGETTSSAHDMFAYVSERLEDEVKHCCSTAEDGNVETNDCGNATSDVDFATVLRMESSAVALGQNFQKILAELECALHEVSGLAEQNLSIYAAAVTKSCDNVDNAIKTVYQLMAKVEELTSRLRHIPKTAQQIKEIKRVLDLFEMHLSKSHG